MYESRRVFFPGFRTAVNGRGVRYESCLLKRLRMRFPLETALFFLRLEPPPLPLLGLRLRQLLGYELCTVKDVVNAFVYKAEYCLRIREAHFHLGRVYVDVSFLRGN